MSTLSYGPRARCACRYALQSRRPKLACPRSALLMQDSAMVRVWFPRFLTCS